MRSVLTLSQDGVCRTGCAGRGLQDGVSRMGVKAIVWYGAAIAVGASRLLGARRHAVRRVRLVLSVRIVRRCSPAGVWRTGKQQVAVHSTHSAARCLLRQQARCAAYCARLLPA